MRSKCRSLVAFDEELRLLNFSGLDAVGVRLGQVVFAVITAEPEGGDVELNRCRFSFELLGDCGLQTGLVDAEQFGENTDIYDVGHQLGNFGIDFPRQRTHWDRIGNDVLSHDGLAFGVAVPNHNRTRLKGFEVFLPRCGVDQDLDVRSVAGGLVPRIGEADNVPGRKAGYVGWKEVLSTDRDAHVKQGLEQN